MPTKILDANNPNDVVSAKTLDVLIGAPQGHLLIFTGIAIPNWDSQANLDRELVVIKLGQPATSIINYSATVGLASIYNDNTDFVFGTDDVVLGIDQNMQLELRCNIAVMGEPSVLNRFSYQANVLVDIDEPLIAGTIRWTSDLAQVNRQSHLFTVTATAHLDDGSSFLVDQVVAQGEDIAAPSLSGNMLEVPYVIRNVPLNTPVTILPVVQVNAFTFAHQGDTMFNQTAGPSPVTLTFQHLKEAPVDFTMIWDPKPL